MSLKLLVNNKDVWEAFLEEVDERVEFAHKQLEQASTMEDMFRLQGEVRALRKLYKLRDKVNG
jgi:hypothetical protein